jgi:hypothetical protein
MSDISLSTTVNRHYLDKLLQLAERMPVLATEDIFDARGTRVLAAGACLTREHAVALTRHKLRKTLESSLAIEGGVDTSEIVGAAMRILNASVPMGRILRATGGNGASPLKLLSSMEFGAAMRMMLTLTDHQGPQALEHCVTVSLLAICMAKKLHLSDEDQLSAGLAGLLHDIGELYIDPVYLAPGKRLLPHEWAHLVAHPRLGQMLINELESYPLAVGRAVAEHHERFDGTGYPRQVVGNHTSAPGQAVAVAEMIAGVLHKDHPLERAELALKIVPGEHAHDLLSAISGALRCHARPDAITAPEEEGGEGAERLFWRISSAIEAGQNLLDGSAAKSRRACELLERTLGRIKTIQRAFVSTGLDAYLNHNHAMHEGVLKFEKEVATREIQWRLRDIARDLALHTAASPNEKSVFSCLIHLLDDDSDRDFKRDCGKPAALAIPAPASSAGSRPHAV